MASPYLRPVMRIALIGNGNLAWHLSTAFRNAGLRIDAHLSRNSKNSLGWEMYHNMETIPADIDVFLLAVPDSSIAAVAIQLPLHATVIHFSGASELDVIQHPNRAVCWPCQTLTKGTEIDYTQIPVLYEFSNAHSEHIIRETLMKAWGTWTQADGKQRLMAHAAAVFSNNFTNHMQFIAHQLLHEARLPAKLLHPMVKAHMQLLDTHEPAQVQTGPAKRHDMDTLQRHLHTLQHHPDWKKLYESISEDIITTYNNP